MPVFIMELQENQERKCSFFISRFKIIKENMECKNFKDKNIKSLSVVVVFIISYHFVIWIDNVRRGCVLAS